MASDPKLKARFELETMPAVRAMQSAKDKIAKNAGELVTSFAGPIASIAALKVGIMDSIRASQEHETVMARVRQAGIANVRAFDQWAESLQRATGVSSDMIANQAAITKSLGASEDQAKLFTQAALELSAALGRDLASVQSQLNKTLGGTLGELAELVPAMKDLTAEQLKAGEAAQFIMQQFGGSAASQAQTMTGQVRTLAAAFNDLQQAIGDALTGGSSGQGINLLTMMLDKASDLIGNPRRGSNLGFYDTGVTDVADRYRSRLGWDGFLSFLNGDRASMEQMVGRGFAMPGFRGRMGGLQSPEAIIREELQRDIVLRPQRVELQLGGLTDGGAFPGMPGPRGSIGATDLSGLPAGSPFEQPRMTGNDWLQEEIQQREYIRDLTEQSMNTLTQSLLDSIFYARDLSDVFKNLLRDIMGSVAQGGVRALAAEIFKTGATTTAGAGGGSYNIGKSDNNPTAQSYAREINRQQAKARRRGF